jgi:hypothetical protein
VGYFPPSPSRDRDRDGDQSEPQRTRRTPAARGGGGPLHTRGGTKGEPRPQDRCVPAPRQVGVRRRRAASSYDFPACRALQGARRQQRDARAGNRAGAAGADDQSGTRPQRGSLAEAEARSRCGAVGGSCRGLAFAWVSDATLSPPAGRVRLHRHERREFPGRAGIASMLEHNRRRKDWRRGRLGGRQIGGGFPMSPASPAPTSARVGSIDVGPGVGSVVLGSYAARPGADAGAPVRPPSMGTDEETASHSPRSLRPDASARMPVGGAPADETKQCALTLPGPHSPLLARKATLARSDDDHRTAVHRAACLASRLLSPLTRSARGRQLFRT